MFVKIIPNPKKQWAVDLAATMSSAVKSKGHVIVAPSSKQSVSATICIGGDGTILFASHKANATGPILGIGGAKSYICQFKKDGWMSALRLLEMPEYDLIGTLRCQIGGKRFTVLNDVVLHSAKYRVIELDVSVDDGSNYSFEGDGIIVSSSLGSSAYAYSAGGERLQPTGKEVQIVPICPYKKLFSPKIVPGESAISIRARGKCGLVIDGIYIRLLKEGEGVVITKGPEMKFFKGVGTKW